MNCGVSTKDTHKGIYGTMRVTPKVPTPATTLVKITVGKLQ